MAGIDVAQIANLTIEGIEPEIEKLVITADDLAGQLKSGASRRVSNRLQRIIYQLALAGGDSRAVNLDGGALPLGSAPKWVAGGVTPTVITTATNWTELTALIGEKVADVAVANVVADAVGNLTEMQSNWLDIGLHTDGTGTLATLQSAPATKTVTLNPTPFGARNIEIGQSVDIVNPTGNVTRGSLTVDNKTAYLGSAQTFTYVGADVAGATTSDIVRYGGLTDGAPKWINGLKYLVNTSTTGELHGIPRSTPQMVANGFDMGGSSITRSAIMLLLSQRRARISEKSLTSTSYYTHDSQLQSIKEIGYDLQWIPMQGGEAAKFDPFFRGSPTIEGKPIKIGQHADQQAFYMLETKCFGRVKFADMYFAKIFGSKVYNTYNSGGTPNLQMASCLINPIQFFLANAVAQGVISGLGTPAGHVFGS